jgi:hypothetical protein
MTNLEKISLLIFILASNKLFSEGGDRLEVFAVLIISGSLFLMFGRNRSEQ